MYRPQFAFKSPVNCEEQRCAYSFDQTNTPRLASILTPGSEILYIPLELDKDADFYLRGIQTTAQAALEFRLEDPKGNPLCDTGNVLQESNFQYPGVYSQTNGAGIVTLDNADDYGVFCQAGSRLYLHLFNNGIANVGGLVVTLHGIKRYSGERCAA
jgi:hypothetical protein